MRVGFVDCSSNSVDLFAEASELAEQKMSDTTFSRLTAPDLTKIPACSKRLMNEGVDGVVAFATATGEDADVLRLVHEKVMDVEVSAGKFVFIVVVFDDEARTALAVKELALKRINDSLDHLLSLGKSPSSGTDSAGPDAMGMFGGGELPGPDSPEGDASSGPAQNQGSGSHSIL